MTRSSLALLALLVVGCGGSANDGAPTDAGAVAQEAADESILGLCELVGTNDAEAASTTFQDRSHRTLHLIAAAAEAVDREAAAELLAAKQRVEAALAGAELPSGFSVDVEALLEAARAALGAIGLTSPDCGS